MQTTEIQTVGQKLRHSNVWVSSVAGSGKTTTILAAATELQDFSPMLLLTYNSRLKIETKLRAENAGLALEVRSFHSFCCAYLDRSCIDDIGIMRALEEGKTFENVPPYRLVFVDETQDMNLLFFIVCKASLGANPRICVVGDVAQSINEFRGADSRFLTLAKEVFGNEWAEHFLPTSYRITYPMADFINIACNQRNKINAQKEGGPVIYFCGGGLPFYEYVKSIVKKFGPENVMVLSATQKNYHNNNPAVKLADGLSANGIPVHLLESSDTPDAVLAGKVLFCTFHKAKGLEREAVVVVGFDGSYYQGKKIRATDAERMTNDLYVGLTRAKTLLVVVQTSGQKPLPFVSSAEIYARCVVKGDRSMLEWSPAVPNGGSDPASVRVTDLCEHVASETLYECIKKVNIETPDCSVAQDRTLATRSLTRQRFGGKKTVEIAADITGVAIPSHVEYLVLSETTAGQSIKEKCKKARKKGYVPRGMTAHQTGLFSLDIVPANTAALLYVSNLYICATSSKYYKMKQISNYDWLPREVLDKGAARILPFCTGKIRFEHPANRVFCDKTLRGQFDLLVDKDDDTSTIIEFKCVEKLQTEHFIQVIVYLALQENATCGVLYNCKKNEMAVVTADRDALEWCVRHIIHAKYHPRTILDDVNFIRKTRGETVQSPPCERCRTL